MKKLMALLSIVALTSCGSGGSTTEVKTDSTTVVADSTVKADSTVAPVADTAKAAEETK